MGEREGCAVQETADATSEELQVAFATTTAEIDLALAIRRRVFVEEQGIALAEEIDGRDGVALHVLAWLRLRPADAAQSSNPRLGGSTPEISTQGVEFQGSRRLARWRGEAVGAARVLIEGDQAVLARIAVLPEHRGRNIAPRMIAALERRARQLGATRAELHPHDYLEEFYRRLGYRTVPGPIEELGEHRLICMAKALG